VDLRRIAALGLAGLLAGLLTACGAKAPPSPGASAPSNPGNLLMGRTSLGRAKAPDFTLTNQFGQKVSLSDLRGKVVLLAFTDSECTTVCPLTTASMVAARKLLGAAGRHVEIVNVDANPDAITVQDVYDYADAHGILHSSEFLTGSLAQLKQVWKLYGISVQVIAGNIDHTPALFLIDQQGRERYLYLTNGRYGVVGAESKVLAYDVAHVLPPGTATAPALPKSTANPLGSAGQQVTLPALAAGGPSVTLTAGQPRIVVFFGSWLPDVVEQLDALDGYAAWAKQHGAPPLLAVDEAVTEPSLAVARSRLAALKVDYPLVVDSTGSVADAYRVQDLSWIAFRSAEGKLIDSHDSWVPVANLEQQVRKDYRLP